MRVGDWYRWRDDDKHRETPRHAFLIIAVGRDFVIYRFKEDYPACYMTKTDFEAAYELLVEA